MKIFYIVLMVFFIIPIVSSTSYYVSYSEGNDSYSGNISHPFKTLAKGSSTVVNNDSLLLKSGDYWFSENITISKKNNITISNYGVGTRPIIDSRDLFDDWKNTSKWINLGNNTWLYNSSYTTNPKRIWLDEVETARATSNITLSSFYKWYWYEAEDRIILYSLTNPAITFTNITIGYEGERSSIFLQDSLNINISNLNMGGSRFASLYLLNTSNSTISNSDIGCNDPTYGVYLLNNSNFNLFHDLNIDNCANFPKNTYINSKEYGHSQDGISIKGGSNNTFYNINITEWGHVQLYVEGINNQVSKYNKFYNITITNPYGDYAKSLGFEGWKNNCTNNEFYNSTIKNVSNRVQFGGNNNLFYNNLVYNIIDYPTSPQSGGTSLERDYTIAVSTGNLASYNNSVYHNTFVNLDEACLMSLTNNTNGSIFRDNICYNTGLNGSGYGKNLSIYIRGNSNGLLSVNNNLFYSTLHDDSASFYLYGTHYNLSSFNSYTDKNNNFTGNIWSNPQLNSNYIPSYDSPACNAASDGGDIGAFTCAIGVSCLGKTDIFCDFTGCYYGLNECTESSGYRDGSIVCNLIGCI